MRTLIIKSMAKERQDLITKLKAIRKTLMPHIVKCLAEGKDNINFNHHLKEVLTQYNAILKIREKEWCFAKRDLLNLYLIGDYFSTLRNVQKLNPNIPESKDVDLAMIEFIKVFLDFIENKEKLSKNDFIKMFSIIWNAC